jgi:hypothetical protein
MLATSVGADVVVPVVGSVVVPPVVEFVGVVVPVNGVPALPPPPPQAAKANVSPNAATHLMKFIRIVP